MKQQGRADRNVSESTKREPISRGVNIVNVADMGIQHVHTKSEPLYPGRGFEAPMAGSDVHPSGSQGKHK